MVPQQVLHVIRNEDERLGAALQTALGARLAVRLWRSAPTRGEHEVESIIVLDPADVPLSVSIPEVEALLSWADLWLVVGQGQIRSEWLSICDNPRVHVLKCASGSRASQFAPIITALAATFGRPPCDRMSEAVLARVPFLQPVEGLVRVICADVWKIRRPKDLAKACGTKRDVLKKRCRDLGFNRVEHLIVLVRALAFQYLTSDMKVSVSLARKMAGFSDASNMKRQVKRALHQSPNLPLGLASLSAA